MSKQRKLQSEIEQTLKRIQEGVTEWDLLWDKMEETGDATHREKMVLELKKDLKKLQRLREQVRGWAMGGDVKDDTRLLDARKAVERQMERFKYLEKEIKIKRFSSEGLKRDSTDPLMVAKVKTADWLSDMVAQLETQARRRRPRAAVEQFEADIEALRPPKGKTKLPRVAELEAFMQRHQDHITRLEQCLRLLENDQVMPEEVEGALKDGVEYYLQSSTEAGKLLRADYLADEALYDSLPLKDVDDSIGKMAAHLARPLAKGKAEGVECEGAEAAPEGGKGKRAKGGKGAKGKGDSGKDKAAAAGKAAITPPPGLPPPPPPPPQAANTPVAATCAASFKEVAATSLRVAPDEWPTSSGGPDTPAPTARAVADSTPAAPQRQGSEAGRPTSPAEPATPLPATPEAAAQGRAPATTGSGMPDVGLPHSEASQAPDSVYGESAGPVVEPEAAHRQEQLPQPAPPRQPPSPAPAAPLGAFNERMQAAAAAYQADREDQQQAAGLHQQQQLAQQGSPQPQPFLAPLQPLSPLRMLSASAGVPQLSLTAGNGHSPFAALANGIAAAGGGLFTGASNGGVGVLLAGSNSQERSIPASPSAGPAGPDRSPRSVHSSASAVADASGPPATPQRSGSPGGHSPTALPFGHPQPQAESVLSLAADDSPLSGTGEDLVGLAATSSACGAEGGPHRASQLPWAPTLADVQCLDASLRHRPQPGDADWRLSDGTISSVGGPPLAAHPVVTPASFPNTVHPCLRREDTWRKLSAETSLFNFYFQQGTRQQLFGANALKTQGWRFHTQARGEAWALPCLPQFNAWFARQGQPRVVTETFEQGPLVYFDSLLHNVTPATGLPSQPVFSGWCPRTSRPDFIYEYKYMEADDTSAPSDPVQ